MSQNKKKFFGKHKNEQELEQTQTLPPMPENNSDKTVQTEENTAPEEASEKADADEENEKAEQLAEIPFAKDLIEASASALSLQPD